MARGHWRRWTYIADVERALKNGSKTVKEISAATGFHQNTVRKHLKSLVVTKHVRKEGRKYSLLR